MRPRPRRISQYLCGLLAVATVVAACGKGPSAPPAHDRFDLAGLVTDGTSPLSAVEVRATLQGPDGGSEAARTRSSEDGRFSFPALPRGRYLLEFQKEGFLDGVSGLIELDRDLTDLVVVLEPVPPLLRHLGGRVVRESAAGPPLPGASVTCTVVDSGEVLGTRTSARDGSFLFEVRPGRYRLGIRLAGYDALDSDPLVVEGEDREGLVFVLLPVSVARSFRLGGTVRDSQGPLARVEVALSVQGEGTWSRAGQTSTDPQGRYAFDALAAGTYALELRKAGYLPATVPAFALDADRTGLDVTLSRAPLDTFRFAVQADIHVSVSGVVPSGMKEAARALVEYVRPSFVFFAGDLTSGSVSGPTDLAVVNYYWDAFFGAISGYLPSGVAYFPSRGNHDYYTEAQRTAYGARWSGLQVPDVRISGDPASYYSFDVGHSHFTVLAGHKAQLGTTQVDWLRADLASAQSAQHRFVVSHLPLVAQVRNSSGSVGYGEITGQTADGVDLRRVLQDGRITSLFVGHEHVFRDLPEASPGVRQVSCGTAAGTYNFPFLDGTQQELLPSFVVVDVTGPRVEIHGVRDEPRFTTTWARTTLPPPPAQVLPVGESPPQADLLLVDGWQRGSLDERAALRARALAMFEGLEDPAGHPLSVAMVDQAAVASTRVALAPYRGVVYLLENESALDRSFTELEQGLVEAYVEAGGKLVVSGSEVGYDLVEKQHGSAFYERLLGARYIADDAATGVVSGVAGTEFAGLVARFAQDLDPWRYPDVIAPLAHAQELMRYGTSPVAATGWRDGNRAVVYFAFAIDGLDEEPARRAVARAALQYLGLVPE